MIVLTKKIFFKNFLTGKLNNLIGIDVKRLNPMGHQDFLLQIQGDIWAVLNLRTQDSLTMFTQTVMYDLHDTGERSVTPLRKVAMKELAASISLHAGDLCSIDSLRDFILSSEFRQMRAIWVAKYERLLEAHAAATTPTPALPAAPAPPAPPPSPALPPDPAPAASINEMAMAAASAAANVASEPVQGPSESVTVTVAITRTPMPASAPSPAVGIPVAEAKADSLPVEDPVPAPAPAAVEPEAVAVPVPEPEPEAAAEIMEVDQEIAEERENFDNPSVEESVTDGLSDVPPESSTVVDPPAAEPAAEPVPTATQPVVDLDSGEVTEQQVVAAEPAQPKRKRNTDRTTGASSKKVSKKTGPVVFTGITFEYMSNKFNSIRSVVEATRSERFLNGTALTIVDNVEGFEFYCELRRNGNSSGGLDPYCRILKNTRADRIAKAAGFKNTPPRFRSVGNLEKGTGDIVKFWARVEASGIDVASIV